MSVENLWKKRHSPTYLKKNLPILRKRKTFEHSSPVPSKIGQFSKQKLDESMSVSSEICVESENITETSLSQQATLEVSQCDQTVDSDRFDDTSKMSEKETENIEEKMETEDTLNELNVSENSNVSIEAKGQDSESVNSFTGEKNIFFCSTSEVLNEESVFFNEMTCITDAEKGEIDTFDSNEGNVYMREEEQHFDDSVAAFHDITAEVTEEVTSDVIIEIDQEPETIEIVTVEDSGDEINVVSDTESVDKNEKKNEETKDEKSKDEESKDKESKKEESKEEGSKEEESKEEESKEEESKEEESKDEEFKEEESKEESRPRREKAARKIPGIKPRKSRPSQEYVRRRNRRNAARAQKEKKAKSAQKEMEDFDYATFDYTYFSELSEEDKYEYLAMQHLVLSDDTEGKFKRENFKLLFVQHCDTFLYRLNCLSKAKEVGSVFYFLYI